MLAGVDRARANDQRCGAPDERTRICRTLFLVATLDPALHLDDPQLRHRIGEAIEWALNDAQSVAPTQLADAFHSLETATRTLATSADEQSLADALALRAQPIIAEVIDQHWRNNCG